MKQILLLIYSWMFLTYPIFSQTIDWIASTPYPTYVTFTNKIVVDNEGSSYIMGGGRFNAGVYLIKYDKAGIKQWEKKFLQVFSGDISVDNLNNIYFFIGACENCSFTIEGNYFKGSVLAKINKNGSFLWGYELKYNLFFPKKFNSNNRINVTGYFISDNITLKGGIYLQKTDPHVCHFIGEMDENGDFIWAIPDEHGLYIQKATEDCFYINGWFNNTLTLGKGNKQVTFYESNGMSYFAKYNINGELVYAKQVRSPLVSPDKYGNAYTLEHKIANSKTAYITKYDLEGNLLWQRTSVYLDKWYCIQMACGSNGDLFVAGGFANYMTIGDTTIYGHNDYRLFVAKMDSSGALKWVITSEGPGGAGTKDIAVRGNEIYVTGDIGGEIKIGNHTIYEELGIFTLKIIDGDKPTNVINQVKETGSINLFPNPTNSNFTIHYQSEKSSPISFKVRTLTGAIIYEAIEQKPVGKIEKQINLGSPAPGVYLVEVTSDGERFVKKVVVGR